MTKRGGAARKAAGAPTALVAAVARGNGRRSRRRGKAAALPDLSAAIRSAPEALGRHLPGGGRSGLARLGRRRRGPSLLKVARHAGTAVSAIGFASDLLAQINTLAEANRKPDRPDPEPPSGDRSPGGRPRSRRSNGDSNGRVHPADQEAPVAATASNRNSNTIDEEQE